VNEQERQHTFALANAFKEGDLQVGGTTDDRLRAEARLMLLATTLGEVRRCTFVNDSMTAVLERSRDRRFDQELDPLTVAQFKNALLEPGAAAWVAKRLRALPSEAIAAVVKVMTNEELSRVARTVFNPLDGSGVAIGSPGHFGSRIQPNSPGDDEQEILFSILEGLAYGCGDVIIGLNPAADDLDTIVRLEQLLEQVVRRLELPTRYCVLSDIIKQHDARMHTRIDVGFQSLAGTSRALAGMVALDVEGVIELARDFDGLYFETGQGSEVTNGAAEGIDMVTLEARTYGVARHIRQQTSCRWMIVNDVAGFVGPEVFRNAEQLERACLEDVVMAKLHGLTMGLDVCATFHMGISPRELFQVTERLVQQGAPAYLMAVAGNADPMLGYLTTSFREHPNLRRGVGRRMATAMEQRFMGLGVSSTGEPATETVARLYAQYAQAGGDRRTSATLAEEGQRYLRGLRERGFDLSIDDRSEAAARLDRIYEHARRALMPRSKTPSSEMHACAPFGCNRRRAIVTNIWHIPLLANGCETTTRGSLRRYTRSAHLGCSSSFPTASMPTRSTSNYGFCFQCSAACWRTAAVPLVLSTSSSRMDVFASAMRSAGWLARMSSFTWWVSARAPASTHCRHTSRTAVMRRAHRGGVVNSITRRRRRSAESTRRGSRHRKPRSKFPVRSRVSLRSARPESR
jgi:ethanolamine ammonia-lyase large subunit